MLAAKGSLKLCETERPGGVGGVKTSSRKLRLPSQNGLAPDFTQPFSNLKLFTNTKQEPSAVGSHPQATTEKAKKCQRKKKKDSSLRGRPETPARDRSTASPSQPPGSRPSPSPGRARSRRPRSSFPPRHRARAAAPRTHPAPVTEYPAIRGPHFPVSAHPHPRHGQE